MDPDSTRAPGMNPPQPAGVQVMSMPIADAVQSQGQPSYTQTVQIADETASDEELDQEWVNKAKDIVEQTKADPYTQSNQLNEIKAEYLKARFNKELKVGDKSKQ